MSAKQISEWPARKGIHLIFNLQASQRNKKKVMHMSFFPLVSSTPYHEKEKKVSSEWLVRIGINIIFNLRASQRNKKKVMQMSFFFPLVSSTPYQEKEKKYPQNG